MYIYDNYHSMLTVQLTAAVNSWSDSNIPLCWLAFLNFSLISFCTASNAFANAPTLLTRSSILAFNPCISIFCSSSSSSSDFTFYVLCFLSQNLLTYDLQKLLLWEENDKKNFLNELRTSLSEANLRNMHEANLLLYIVADLPNILTWCNLCLASQYHLKNRPMLAHKWAKGRYIAKHVAWDRCCDSNHPLMTW